MLFKPLCALPALAWLACCLGSFQASADQPHPPHGEEAKAKSSDAAPSHGGSSAVMLLAGEGCIREVSSGNCTPIEVGGPLTHSSTSGFTAGARGALLQLADGSLVSLEKASAVNLTPTTLLPLGPGDLIHAQSLGLQQGKLTLSVAPSAGRQLPAVLIRAPQQVSVIARAGSMTIHATPESVSVGSLTQELLVASGNHWQHLSAGQARTFQRQAPDGVSHPLLPAPHLTPSITVSSFPAASGTSPVSISWTEVPGAAGYEVMLQRQGEQYPLSISSVKGSDHTLVFSALPAGEYAAFVRAFDTEGMDSPPSETAVLNVVGVELAPGSRLVSYKTIQLGEGQAARLLYATGLEAAWEGERRFTPAPVTLSLPSDHPHMLRLRRPGTFTEARIAVEPRSLTADVQIGPATARWPQDPVKISIHVFDRAGQPLPANLLATPEVRLNLEPISVDWTTQGNTLQAVVPPRAETKPCVLRVEVKDQHGVLLGRNFLEIESVIALPTAASPLVSR